MRAPLVRGLYTLISAVAVALMPAAAERLGAQGSAPARERTAFVSALDANGLPVEMLSPDDVLIREDGVRREALRVTRAAEPMDIAVFIDNSEASRGALLDMRRSVASLLGQLAGGGHNVALIGLAARPTVIVDYTRDAERLQQGIGRYFPMTDTGMTFIDAVTEISNGLGRREATRTVIITIMTDGVEFTNRDARIALDAMRRAGVQMHAITIGTFAINSEDDRERAQLLDTGTRETGGQRHTLLSPTGLDQAVQRVARELLSQYKVVYNRPESLIPPDKTEIGSARAGLTVRGIPARRQGA